MLLGGVAVAVIAAFFLPALQFRGASKAVLGISAWEAVPWLTKLKLGFLAAAVAAAFVPKLAPLRVWLIAAAVVMMFLPALGALTAGVYQWSDVRAEIVQLSGVRAPWVDPGWGLLALLGAALMAIGAAWRAHAMDRGTAAA
ncbi:hypothetical protein CKO45_31650 [Paracraurococcus ruber]|uniref:Uncharacterized protein n=1 Tax=Paracraurococcus ruber TaxID=77675 RepID=A0ABS1D836_9PROT|nr:hypothetical protein [Paracraurococcus ruber]